MAGIDVTTVYRRIIDEVITKSRHDFVQEGVDEAVLDELRVLWEEKLQQTGVLNPEPPRPLPAGVPGTQILHTGFLQPPTQSYPPGYYTLQAQTPSQLGRPTNYMAPASAAVEMTGYASLGPRGQTRQMPVYTANPQTTVQRPQQPGQPGRPRMQPQGAPRPQVPPQPAANQHAQGLYQFIQSLQTQQQGRPSQSTHPPQQAAYQHPRGISQVQQQQHRPGQPAFQRHGAPQHYHPGMTQQVPHHSPALQQPGAMAHSLTMPHMHDDATRKRKAEEAQVNDRKQPPPAFGQAVYGTIPQRDGPADGSEAGSEKDADKANGEEEAVAAAIDNLSDVPSSDEEEEEVPNHCISQYTKVTRTKNRWKAMLLAGIMHLNGRDHCFHVASGEFTF